jgi:hypothetical protein
MPSTLCLPVLLLVGGQGTSPDPETANLYERLLREDNRQLPYPVQLYFDEPRWPAIRADAGYDATPRGGSEIISPRDGSVVYIDHSMESKPLAFLLQLSLYVTSILQLRSRRCSRSTLLACKSRLRRTGLRAAWVTMQENVRADRFNGQVVSVFDGNRSAITVLLPPVADGRHSLTLECASGAFFSICHALPRPVNCKEIRGTMSMRRPHAGTILESSSFDVRRLRRKSAAEGPPEVIFAAHLYHDAAMAFVKAGRVVAVLELERIFRRRYFSWVDDTEDLVTAEGRLALHWQLHVSIEALRTIATGEIPRDAIFDLAVTTHCPRPCVDQTGPCLLPGWQQVWSYMWRCLLGYSLLSQLLPVRQWAYAEHHRSHAALGFYDSPYALARDASPTSAVRTVHITDTARGAHRRRPT